MGQKIVGYATKYGIPVLVGLVLGVALHKRNKVPAFLVF